MVIPTYEPGEPQKNPMFLEGRVYQGSSGKVYPYPVTEDISYEKTDRTYRAVFLENQYLKVMVLPELGGRIQRAYDKTNGYDFVYYNHVIKPALVGLTGPWISGGIEFNWPQHHRPTTYLPVDFKIEKGAEGSGSVLVHDVDQMYGTKGTARFTLYPDRAYIEIAGRLYNRTPLPQTFLWWANPAVPVNDQTQSVFPPDVHFVMDHGKRDVSRFPIARGVYYKHDYSEGVDISRYKNIPVPTSYMAQKSKYDFVGGYDYGREAGILHVADHHISPGKKQWTWGCGEFGKAWDRNLTDEDGPYIELMTGVYTDNQPDFTWLKPFEEKTFRQYFMPYKKAGMVKNASVDAVLHTEKKGDRLHVTVYATSLFEEAAVRVLVKDQVVSRERVRLSPMDIYEGYLELPGVREEDIRVEVLDGKRVLVGYQKEELSIPEMARPAQPAAKPEEIRTNEELFLTGQHLEQYRHATYLPDPYYLEGLKRDPGDIRINNAYGLLLLRRGCFAQAEAYFRKALERLTWKNPNPYDSEAYYNLGLCLFYEGETKDSFDNFYKATWSSEQQEMSFYYLAAISASRGETEQALEFVDKSLVKNSHSIKARGLRALLLDRLGRREEARQQARDNLALDPFDFVSFWLLEQMEENGEKRQEYRETRRERMRDFPGNYLMAARDFMEAGAYAEALAILAECGATHPLLNYYRAFCADEVGRSREAETLWQEAQECDPGTCFPNKLEDIAVLERAADRCPGSSMAWYYLGNLWYDRLQSDRAVRMWEQSARIRDDFPTVHRNLSIAYYNKQKDSARALWEMERAFALDETDARVFLEMDQLRKKEQVPPERRMVLYEEHMELVEEREDLLIEYAALCNMAGQYRRAYDLIMAHRFRPWEGGEGKVTVQYKTALLQMAKEHLAEGEPEQAEACIRQALTYPENLGEGRLEGTKDNHLWYHLGLVRRAQGDEEEARRCFRKATEGSRELGSAMFYYDQPADMVLCQGLALRELGDEREACACFNSLLDYGEEHLADQPEVDYFAVSLPDFLVFEEDRTLANQVHCHYLMGLAYLGYGRKEEARRAFRRALELDNSHQNCRIYLEMAERE